MEEQEILKEKLNELKVEHRRLDEMIAEMTAKPPFDQILVQRLKKRKLALKDQIARIDSRLMPDIIA